MKVSPVGITVMHYFESCKLLAYPDPASPLFKALQAARIDPFKLDKVPVGFERFSGAPWTIGWGHTGPEVVCGLRWTQQQADQSYQADLARFERDVAILCTRPPDQGQFDALVSFAYNVGSDIDTDTIAEGLGDSTLLRKFNAGDVPAAADQFLAWDRAGGKSMWGLRRRRAAERILFLGGTAAEAIATADRTL